jgi:hypothetical protein
MLPDTRLQADRSQTMSEKAAMLEPGFSVADATYPTFRLRDGEVVLEFTDWRDRPVRIRFTNAAGVRWQELDSAGPEERDDAVFEIIESIWLAEYLRKGARTPADDLRHYRLCFNAAGVLDVLATSMKVEDAD